MFYSSGDLKNQNMVKRKRFLMKAILAMSTERNETTWCDTFLPLLLTFIPLQPAQPKPVIVLEWNRNCKESDSNPISLFFSPSPPKLHLHRLCNLHWRSDDNHNDNPFGETNETKVFACPARPELWSSARPLASSPFPSNAFFARN